MAGPLDARLNIGDVLVSTDAVHHDVDATNFGYAPGEVPSLGIRFFPADAGLRAAAVEAPLRAAAPDVACVEGRVASGDQFVRTQDQKDGIQREFDASCVEMEGASIAQTAWLNGVPFVIVRAISDKADGSAEVEYPCSRRRPPSTAPGSYATWWPTWRRSEPGIGPYGFVSARLPLSHVWGQGQLFTSWPCSGRGHLVDG